jgi:acetoin utilization protein AcuC
VGDRVKVCWGPDLASYDFGPDHPMQPVRVRLAMALARAAGILDGPRVRLSAPAPLADADLARTHSPTLIALVKRAGADPDSAWKRDSLAAGIGPDTPPFPGMHQAAALVCGASTAAARAVWSGEAEHAFAPAGGLHHAARDRCSGFCVYNDCSTAIAALLDAGAERVAYVDVDVHHGDGTQWIHYGDPRVMTCSIHESGRYLFPGTGFVEEAGAGKAEGTSVNVPMPPFAGTGEWLVALREVVLPLVEAFQPQVLVTQGGADSHHLDPLAHVQTTIDVFPSMWRDLHALAHRVCGGRWLGLGGGGYQLYSVVPRAWAMLLAEMLDSPPGNTPLPGAWLTEASAAGGRGLPAAWLEDSPPERPAAVASRVGAEAERSVSEARARLFRRWGLRP